MNIKVQIREVIKVIDHRVTLAQVYSQLRRISPQAEKFFPEPQTGAGYLQWSLPGGDWTSFTQASDDQKAVVAQVFQERREEIMAALSGSPFRDDILTFPSEDFIYFRSGPSGMEVAMTAWGHKYPDRPGCVELDTWIHYVALQQVNIGFLWDGQRLPQFHFRLASQPRITADDGLFRVDLPLPVGKTHSVETLDGRHFDLTVVQGQADYDFDLTQYFDVVVSVTQDGLPSAGRQCQVSFDGQSHTLQTDAAGKGTLRLPMVADGQGVPLQQQPAVTAACEQLSEQQVPSVAQPVANFQFAFTTPKPEGPEKREEPVKEEEPKKPEVVVEPEPPEEVKEPEFVTLQLLDYGGEPLPDLTFTVTLKKKGPQQFTTDAQGCYKMPKEWFTPKEKMQVSFVVTPEYQAQHDLHDGKKKKK